MLEGILHLLQKIKSLKSLRIWKPETTHVIFLTSSAKLIPTVGIKSSALAENAERCVQEQVVVSFVKLITMHPSPFHEFVFLSQNIHEGIVNRPGILSDSGGLK